MKRFLTTLLLGFGVCQALLARGGGTPNEYYNYKYLSAAPTVDARIFVNAGTINIDTIVSSSPTNVSSALNEYGANPIPFMTMGTRFFTNTSSGQMFGYPGFRFDTGAPGSRRSAAAFENFGLIESLDFPGFPDIYSPLGTTVATALYNYGAPIPSQISIFAKHIYNRGTLEVGNYGLLRLSGTTITNYHGNLIAGQAETVGPTNTVDFNLTALEGLTSWDAIGGNYYFVPDVSVYDLFWGITNALTIDTSGFAGEFPTGVPNIVVTPRAGDLAPGFPVNFDTAQFSASAYLYAISSNYYYNVIFVNTNFNDTNITATAKFTFPYFPEDLLTVPNNDINAEETIVEISEPVFDVITGQMVTNGIYVIDDGAVLPSMSIAINDSTPEGRRPNAFSVITATPGEWLAGTTGDMNYDGTVFYQAGASTGTKEPVSIAEYGAQIGHNPASLDGSFASLANSNSIGSSYLSQMRVVLPDPTNLSGRIELNAGNLDLTMARIRAEGTVVINTTNLGGSNPTGVDWGEENATIGTTNGILMVSNIFPSTFSRIRGDVYAWSANWQNITTNAVTLTNGNTILGTAGATNVWHFHVTVVDQNIFGTFPSVVRNLTLNGPKSLTLSDNLGVINQVRINTANLIVATNVVFSQNAENFVPANVPYLKNLLIEPTGYLGVQNTLDIGFDPGKGQSGPVGRKYSVDTVTNYGTIYADVPQIQARTVEQDGFLFGAGIGSVDIQAENLFMGLSSGLTNYTYAGTDVYLSAMNIEATNSVIYAGYGGSGTLTIQAENHLSDLVPGTPTTNTNSVIVNTWYVTDGFNLPVKPATGDLFGTELYTYAGNNQQITHVWAAEDRGASPIGFTNNATIGHLVLDRSSNGVLRFSGAGTRNAMYVDYLDLTNYARTNYRSGIQIDPNMTIYFADSNGDPGKLTNTVSGLVWVPSFVGPNSVRPVPYYNSSIVCLMNDAVANSHDISFWPSYGANYYVLNGDSSAPPDPYLLNDPGDLSSNIPCPGNYTFPCNCAPGSNQVSYLVNSSGSGGSSAASDVLTIAHSGLGSTTPTLPSNSVVLGTSYTLTARPASGWIFADWIVSQQGAVTTSYDQKVTFAFLTNTVATASFVENPFPSLEGSYAGLFYDTNAVAPDSSGLVKLSLASTGGFSGKLQMGPYAYNFNSKFNGAGIASFDVKGHGGVLAVYLQLDTTGISGGIVGTVTGSSFAAQLAADYSPFYPGNSRSPFAGSFVTVLPWDAGTDSTNETGGDSWGVGSVTPQGQLTLVGSLADGSHFSSSAPVSKYGNWPFYAYSPSTKDTVLGWATVSNGISGANIAWVKPTNGTPLYPNGFDNIMQMSSSPWHTPTAASSHPFVDTNILMLLNGGDLAAPITNTLGTKDFATYTGPKSAVTIGSAGNFAGWFINPANNHKVPISGVVLTNISIGSSGRGYFLGTNVSGTVLLQNR